MTLDGSPGRPQFYPAALNRQVHGLRGLAALLVFVFHVYGMAVLWGFWPAAHVESFAWIGFGKHAVELFFMISGYLIAGSVMRHGNARLFLLDRCIRIYPVFLAIHVLVFGLGPAIGYKWMAGITPTAWLQAFVENALFLPGLFDLPLAQLNAWSLSYEAGFYLLCAAIYVVGRRLGRAAGWGLLGLATVPLLYLYPRASFFLVGVAIHFLLARAPGIAVPGCLRPLSPLLLAATLAALTLGEHADLLIYAACLPGFLFFWCIVEGRCLVSAVLRVRPLQYLGTISYSFYLWSALVTYPLKLALVALLPPPVESFAAVAAFAALGLALSLGVAKLSFVWLEERAGRYLRRAVRARTGRRVAAMAKEGQGA